MSGNKNSGRRRAAISSFKKIEPIKSIQGVRSSKKGRPFTPKSPYSSLNIKRKRLGKSIPKPKKKSKSKISDAEMYVQC